MYQLVRLCGRVLVWRRSDNVCFTLVLADEDSSVSVGCTVKCVVRGVLQVHFVHPAPAFRAAKRSLSSMVLAATTVQNPVHAYRAEIGYHSFS